MVMTDLMQAKHGGNIVLKVKYIISYAFQSDLVVYRHQMLASWFLYSMLNNKTKYQWNQTTTFSIAPKL